MKSKLPGLVVACLGAVVADEVLPSGPGDELRADATDVLIVSVLSVKVEAQSKTGDPCVTDFDITGRVVAVNATSLDAMEGDMVNFRSYGVDLDSQNCLGYVGPLPPPELEAGWCGFVYLKSSGGGRQELDLAAHGHSFVPAFDTPECQNNPVSAKDRSSSDGDSPEIDVGDFEDEKEADSENQSGSRITGVQFAIMSTVVSGLAFLLFC